MGEYKVYKVEGGYQIFWCPSAPVHYAERIPYDGKVYSKRQAAYRRVKQLSEELEQQRRKAKEEAIAQGDEGMIVRLGTITHTIAA